MRTTQLPASTRRSQIPHLPRQLQSLLVAGLTCGLLMVSTVPAHAWWFDAPAASFANGSSVKSGLTVQPLAAPLAGSFLLQPLSTPTPTPTLQLNVAPKPTVKAATTRNCQPTLVAPATNTPEQIINAVNVERAKLCLTQLRLNTQLSRSAQAYAEEMQQKQFFSHTSPSGTTLKERNESAGYLKWSWMGENIAYGQTSVSEVVTAWMNSEGHRQNILDSRAQELGVGFASGSTAYWVQEFGAQY